MPTSACGTPRSGKRRPVVVDGGSPVFQQPVGLNHKTLNLNYNFTKEHRYSAVGVRPGI